MIFNLNLTTELTYRPDTCSFKDIYSSGKAGSEECFYCHYSFEDVLLQIDILWSGSRAPYTDREKKIIESGLPVPPRDDEKLFIPKGAYRLLQTLPVETLDELKKVLLPFTAEQQDGYFYLRFYRESEIECVMQLFFPV